ncbi:MAG: Ribonuclease [Armatimonadota bacterium]
MTIDRTLFEAECQANGWMNVAGVDEVGRGPLAGPVVTAAVIFPPGFNHADIKDSKKLTEAKRILLVDVIKQYAICWNVDIGPIDEIDKINILQATWASMRRAVNGLRVYPDALLVDGSPVPRLHERCTPIVKGDDKSVTIAAASILAKVIRDNIMVDAHKQYPVYGFDRHKGYPSPEHLAALREFGPCPLHRRSYAPVAQAALDFGIQ